jgi:hypothetical protein
VREGKEGVSRLGQAHEGGRGRRVGWAGPASQKKEGNRISFLIFKPIFECFYKLNFEQISFCLNSHITKNAAACMHPHISKLTLNFNFPKIIIFPIF